ncbi:MAG: hypothetical protein ABI353_08630, partial [Isosphaeraceae bacterium]
NRMPAGLTGFFPGLDRSRDASAPSSLLASRSAPEAPRPSVVREPPATSLNLARTFREPPPSILPVAVIAEVYPEEPRPRTVQVARRAVPRDEATHLAQAETSDEPISLPRIAEANDVPATAEFPGNRAPADDLAEPPTPTILDEPDNAAPDASPAELADDQLEFDPTPTDPADPAADLEVMPPVAEVDDEPINQDDVIDAPPPPRPAQTKPAVVFDPDINGDPNLVGRPRMPLIRPIRLPADLPPPSFPRTYYGPEPGPKPQTRRISTSKTPSPPPQPRRSWSARLVQRWRGFHDQPPSTRWKPGDFPDSRSYTTNP